MAVAVGVRQALGEGACGSEATGGGQAELVVGVQVQGLSEHLVRRLHAAGQATTLTHACSQLSSLPHTRTHTLNYARARMCSCACSHPHAHATHTPTRNAHPPTQRTHRTPVAVFRTSAYSKCHGAPAPPVSSCPMRTLRSGHASRKGTWGGGVQVEKGFSPSGIFGEGIIGEGHTSWKGTWRTGCTGGVG